MPKDVTKLAKKIIKEFPASENWRLFIDGNRQSEGKWAFDTGADKEKGYCQAMQESWNRMIETLSTPLSLSEVKTIHDFCLGRASGQVGVEGVVQDSSFRKMEVDFGILSDVASPQLGNVSLAGLTEYFEAVMRKDKFLPQLAFLYNTGQFDKDFHLDPQKSASDNAQNLIIKLGDAGGRILTSGKPTELAQFYVDQYLKEIEKATLEDDKVMIIAKCVANLERIHLFNDGNCRTMLMLTNKLLLQNGLSPTIFENPNRLDLHSMLEIATEIKRGQKLYQSYKTDKAEEILQSVTLNTARPFDELLKKSISTSPIIALAQLNQLYEKIVNGDIQIKDPQAKKDAISEINWMFNKAKNVTRNNPLKTMILNEIKQLYAGQLDLLSSEIIKQQKRVDELREVVTKLVENSKDLKFGDKNYFPIKNELAEAKKNLGRAKKGEQWYVERLSTLSAEHKNINANPSAISKLVELSKREKYPDQNQTIPRTLR